MINKGCIYLQILRIVCRVLFKLQQYHGQIFVLSSAPKGKNLLLLSWHAHQHVVKDVIVSLLRRLHMRTHVCYHKKIWLVAAQANIHPNSLPTWRHTLDFSSRYWSMRAPSMAPVLVKLMSMYFPKRLELSFRTVLALPKAEKKITFIFTTADQVLKKLTADELVPSRMGLASRICCSIQECWPLTIARYCSMSLVLSVFPAPDSPLTGKSKG